MKAHSYFSKKMYNCILQIIYFLKSNYVFLYINCFISFCIQKY